MIGPRRLPGRSARSAVARVAPVVLAAVAVLATGSASGAASAPPAPSRDRGAGPGGRSGRHARLRGRRPAPDQSRHLRDDFAEPALAAELRLPVDRWGGNSASRYNYTNSTWNTGSDYFFENIVLPPAQSLDAFVAETGPGAAGPSSRCR